MIKSQVGTSSWLGVAHLETIRDPEESGPRQRYRVAITSDQFDFTSDGLLSPVGMDVDERTAWGMTLNALGGAAKGDYEIGDEKAMAWCKAHEWDIALLILNYEEEGGEYN